MYFFLERKTTQGQAPSLRPLAPFVLFSLQPISGHPGGQPVQVQVRFCRLAPVVCRRAPKVKLPGRLEQPHLEVLISGRSMPFLQSASREGAAWLLSVWQGTSPSLLLARCNAHPLRNQVPRARLESCRVRQRTWSPCLL